MSTATTLAHHLQAISEGVDSIMSDYTEESVVFTPNGPLRGLAAIRPFFESFLRDSPPELLQALTVTRQDIVGEVAYLLWKAEPYIPAAADTFVIRNDKIVAQTYASLSV